MYRLKTNLQTSLIKLIQFLWFVDIRRTFKKSSTKEGAKSSQRMDSQKPKL